MNEGDAIEERPVIASTAELEERWDDYDPPDSKLPTRCGFVYLGKDAAVWFCQYPGRVWDVTVDQINQDLERQPNEAIYPLASDSITTYDGPRTEDVFLKRPSFHFLTSVAFGQTIACKILAEAQVLEIVKDHPHPNIERYLGCKVQDGWLTALCLKQYNTTLDDRVKETERPFDRTRCIAGIRAGVKHLHSLRLAHNDLKPENIAVDDDDNPVLIDFGSCNKFGEFIYSCGSPGWVDDESNLSSAPEHDEEALENLERWLFPPVQ